MHVHAHVSHSSNTTIATRPNVAQAVGVVSKFCSKPTEAHLTAVKRILRYLKGTLNLAIKYQKSDEALVAIQMQIGLVT